MEGWKNWEGKRVFISTLSNRQYSGKVIKVDVQEYPFLVWLTIIDKFGNHVTFIHSEISLIEEER